MSGPLPVAKAIARRGVGASAKAAAHRGERRRLRSCGCARPRARDSGAWSVAEAVARARWGAEGRAIVRKESATTSGCDQLVGVVRLSAGRIFGVLESAFDSEKRSPCDASGPHGQACRHSETRQEGPASDASARQRGVLGRTLDQHVDPERVAGVEGAARNAGDLASAVHTSLAARERAEDQ